MLMDLSLNNNFMIKTKNISQTVTIKATPHQIYEALMDSKKHSEFTGSAAKISRKVGGDFTAYDDYSSGKNVELIEDKKIVQTWRASDWPPDHFSKITFLLTPVKEGTKIEFTQEGLPEDQAKSVSDGWKDFYWKPLKEFLE